MTDALTRFTRSTPGRKILRRTPLAEPPRLPRHDQRPGPVLDPVVVLGSGAGPDAIAGLLLDWQADVRRRFEDVGAVGSVIVVLDELAHPDEIGDVVLALGENLRALRPGGRIITISRPPSGQDLAQDAARGGIEGFLRTLGHEVRGGQTANGIQVADGVGLDAPGVQGTLRFLLSARSAFIDGQLLQVTTDGGTLPDDWDRALAGRTALITGAARGIGAAVARTLHGLGADLVLLDVPASGTELSRVANELAATPLQLDVTAADAGTRVVSFLRERGLRLDAVVLNAGITRDKMFANMTPDRWDPVIAVNISSQIALAGALLDAGDAEDAGTPVVGDELRVVSLASTSGIAGNKGQANYATSKAGVIAFVRSLATRLETIGGTANAVAPGFIETEMTARMPTLQREVARRASSLQQGGLPLDVAEAIGFLCSGPAGGLRGETLRVCGQNLVGK